MSLCYLLLSPVFLGAFMQAPDAQPLPPQDPLCKMSFLKRPLTLVLTETSRSSPQGENVSQLCPPHPKDTPSPSHRCTPALVEMYVFNANRSL